MVVLVGVARQQVALLASLRAMSTVSTPQTSAASRAATSFVMNSLVGTSTLPPRWPHFLTEASYPRSAPPRPRRDHVLHDLE